MRSHKVRHWPCLRPYLLKSSGQACFPDLTQHGSIPTCIIPSSIIPILHHCSSCHWDSMVSPGQGLIFILWPYWPTSVNLASISDQAVNQDLDLFLPGWPPPPLQECLYATIPPRIICYPFFTSNSWYCLSWAWRSNLGTLEIIIGTRYFSSLRQQQKLVHFSYHPLPHQY